MTTLTRREFLGGIVLAAVASPRAQQRTVTTILGTGVPGFSDTQVNNPYGANPVEK